ncbi:hypothetical protein HDV01_000550 [Terramyces sp. JEL0728]|nr:hypothetical protein HDV01_000550 [Terramyces sp. JEL0728]
MQTTMENTRQYFEDLDRLEASSVYQMTQKTGTYRDKILQQKRISDFVNEIQSKSKEIVTIYQTDFKQQVDKMTDFNSFYEQLKEIKDFYKNKPNELVSAFDPSVLLTDYEIQELDGLFSGEEGYGRQLDLHDLFLEYLNLPSIARITYLSYLDRFDRFKDYSEELKQKKDYFEYIWKLKEYLFGWIKRSQPLFNLEEMQGEIKKRFEMLWKEGQVPLWEKQLAPIRNPDLYCVACDKHFAKDTVFKAHETGKKHIKAAKELNGPVSKEQRMKERELVEYEKNKQLAETEYNITLIMKHLKEVREDTKAHIERKQALTEKERLDDAEELPVVIQEEDEQVEDEKLYNPLKLPMGWDDKPIPFWLYKLHGLGVEYPCEICGGYIYMGRKAFDKHFQEWRHAHGMRVLGIPNGRFFQDITSIQDAYALAEKLKQQAKNESLNPDIIEEYEDDEGNVYNKKTYEDLKRQGLI